MANKLTGSYDAVAQISRRQLNGLLASLHQNGASEQPPLQVGHNGVLRIGDPKPTTSDLSGFVSAIGFAISSRRAALRAWMTSAPVSPSMRPRGPPR